ncbi:MAG: hypothetical protein AUH28_19330 [Acidobacteria bacterium 13_1_40CM_56_16]|nr:MAG: hypothetical protein AUH28_19330 [Acidobacteria bacterium 13_1_40CM_56_16]
MHLSGNPRAVNKPWYRGVLCGGCKASILFARDFSDGGSGGQKPEEGGIGSHRTKEVLFPSAEKLRFFL